MPMPSGCSTTVFGSLGAEPCRGRRPSRGKSLSCRTRSRSKLRGPPLLPVRIAQAVLLAALLLASAAAALPGGVGVGKMVVDPTRVAAGTTDNVLRFTFTADTAPLAGQTLVDVAPGWTRPQLQNESGPGYVSLRNVTCGPRTRIASLVGRRIVIATSCPLQGQFVLTYANASAPRFASDGFTFVTQTRPAKSLRVNGRLRFRPLA